MTLAFSVLAILAGAASAIVVLPLSRVRGPAFTVCGIGALGPILAAGAALSIATEVVAHGPFHAVHDALYMDGLSALLLSITAVVSAGVMLYSIPYFLREHRQGHLTLGKIGLLYCWVGLLITAMYLTVLCASLGTMWAMIEVTTLLSAPLVGLTGSKASLEATWKYLILATAGISFALLGTLILYASSVANLGAQPNALAWLYLMRHARSLIPDWSSSRLSCSSSAMAQKWA
jgi:hydrogenase-4 component F